MKVSPARGLEKAMVVSARATSRPRLFDDLTLARTDGTYARVLSRLGKAELLNLDDLGLGTPKEQQRSDLLEVRIATGARRPS